jgi:hypothetical protein
MTNKVTESKVNKVTKVTKAADSTSESKVNKKQTKAKTPEPSQVQNNVTVTETPVQEVNETPVKSAKKTVKSKVTAKTEPTVAVEPVSTEPTEVKTAKKTTKTKVVEQPAQTVTPVQESETATKQTKKTAKTKATEKVETVEKKPVKQTKRDKQAKTEAIETQNADEEEEEDEETPEVEIITRADIEKQSAEYNGLITELLSDEYIDKFIKDHPKLCPWPLEEIEDHYEKLAIKLIRAVTSNICDRLVVMCKTHERAKKFEAILNNVIDLLSLDINLYRVPENTELEGMYRIIEKFIISRKAIFACTGELLEILNVKSVNGFCAVDQVRDAEKGIKKPPAEQKQ